MALTSADGELARFAVRELEAAALARLAAEYELSREAIAAGEDATEQRLVVRSWIDWYLEALRSAYDIEVGGASPATLAVIEAAVERVREVGEGYLVVPPTRARREPGLPAHF